MKYSYRNINKVKENIEKDIFIDICKNKSNHFIRKRKIGPKEIVLYELNKKGLTSKMEILNFNNPNRNLWGFLQPSAAPRAEI